MKDGLLNFPGVISSIYIFARYQYSFDYFICDRDNLSTFFILLNRITLIRFPIMHNKIWRYCLPVAIVVSYLAPLPFTYPILGYEFHPRLQADNWSFTLDFPKEEGQTYVNSLYYAAISATSFCIICGTLNITALYLFRKPKEEITTASAARHIRRDIESRLTIYAFVTFLAQLFNSIYYILVYISAMSTIRDNLFLATLNQFPWVNDLSTLVVPSWFLIWASSKIKTPIYRIFKVDRWPVVRNRAKVGIQQSIVLSVNSGLFDK
ncbi:serpentine type 7TM GPCR chemoreceptor srv domain-containing protein [Ditylenchus destructor]|uniref:Serpentine type 7TM GPCR chemoreceptor srv domain-containing protein n=1 Tax=Ditylenchus destructor TaxID=166010 RepID=A0AAD4QXQ2_9BILA|nr:serpentine type 7TM GPCR chemoreceptor srv domain-containing protein [Ditylenchus destructor]